MPTVSVITCTFNRAHLIGQTIESVLNQTFTDFEYIIVDDGSTDNTEAVVKNFKDNRIKYFRHARTFGHLSILRNFGHEKSNGDYIAYVDSDDWWDREKLQLQVSALQKDPEIGFSFTDIEIFKGSEILKHNIYNQTGEFVGDVFPKMLSNQIVICHTTLLVKRYALNKIGPVDTTFHSGDHDLVFFMSRIFKAHIIFRSLVPVRKHDQNSTGNHSLSLKLLDEHHRTIQKLLNQNLITRSEYRKAIRDTSYDFALQLIPSKDYKSAANYFVLNLKYKPFNIKAIIRLFIVLAKKVISY